MSCALRLMCVVRCLRARALCVHLKSDSRISAVYELYTRLDDGASTEPQVLLINNAVVSIACVSASKTRGTVSGVDKVLVSFVLVFSRCVKARVLAITVCSMCIYIRIWIAYSVVKSAKSSNRISILYTNRRGMFWKRHYAFVLHREMVFEKIVQRKHITRLTYYNIYLLLINNFALFWLLLRY